MYDEVKVERKGEAPERFRASGGKKVQVVIHEKSGRVTVYSAGGNSHSFPASVIVRGYIHS